MNITEIKTIIGWAIIGWALLILGGCLVNVSPLASFVIFIVALIIYVSNIISLHKNKE